MQSLHTDAAPHGVDCGTYPSWRDPLQTIQQMPLNSTITIAEAEKLRIRAHERRKHALRLIGSDPIVAEHLLEKSHEEQTRAVARLALSANPIAGPGNEYAAQGKLLTAGAVVSTCKPDAIAAEASLDRIDLVERAQASTLALDLADSERAKTSSEKLFAHRQAVAHKWGMDLIEKATKMPTSDLQIRLIKTAMYCFCTANDTAVKQSKLRGGSQQTFVIKHMNVGPGGQGIMGDVKAPGSQLQRRSRGRG
jgi:hypothetical protein